MLPDMTDEQCGELRVFKGEDASGRPCIISAWRPSLEDLNTLNNGGFLWVSIAGHGMPPIGIYTVDEDGNVNE